MSDDDERVYYECRDCSYGVSGDPWRIMRKVGLHEEQNGHVMEESA